MKESKNIPEIRFEGFEGEWGELTLGDIGQITMGQSPSSVNYTTDSKYHILVQGNSDMKNGKVTPRVWTKQVTKTADSGDLIISVRAPVGDVGKTSYNVVIGRGVAAIKANEFVFQSLIKKKEFGYWDQFSTGSTFESINSNVLKKAIISTTSQKEQSQIGTFFQNLDNQITLEQQKHDKLVTLKKAMLEKMFPKEGARVPEIRFEGFEGEWKEYQINNVAFYRNGRAHENDIEEKGEYIVVNSKFVSTNGEVKKYSNKQNEPLYLDEIAFVLSDVPNGRAIARTFLVDANDKYTLNQRIAAITPSEETDSYFLFILLNRNKYFLQFDDGAKQTNLSKVDVENFSSYYPSKKEQSQIGSYFQNLDKLISLQQQKIDKLKNIKKACLEKMFV